MKLIFVTVENFRSITTARKIKISRLTTLLGPNNEGKSNILRAIVIAMNLLIERINPDRYEPRPRLSRSRRRDLSRYEWKTDCPLKLQAKGTENGSIITLEFDLSQEEIEEFHASIGSKLNGTLPVSFAFRRRGTVEITISKQGPGQKNLNNKAAKIADFIAGKIDYQYIPAVRTAESAREIVEDLVDRELGKAEQEIKYQQALADIVALQEPILDDLSRNITDAMRGFLPDITRQK